MNLRLWVWGIAVGASILLGVPAVAAPSAMQSSQGVSQQSGGNAAAAAERAFTEARELYQQGTAESLKGAIAKLEEALKLYREVGNNERQATSLFALDRVYSDLGENQKALDYYTESVSLSRAVGDRLGEAMTLNRIGNVYSTLGENQKALEYYTQSLPLFRAVGDRRGEATTLNNIGRIRTAATNFNRTISGHSNPNPHHQPPVRRPHPTATPNSSTDSTTNPR